MRTTRLSAVRFGVCALALGAPLSISAQLTDLGAHILHECAAPGDCLELEAFASSLAVGDFDDDGFADLAVGVPGETVGGDAGAGSVHVYFGSPGGLTSLGEQIFDQDSPGVPTAAEAGDRFGGALAAGDFDLDGFDDLAIGLDGKNLSGASDAGAVVVLFGSTGGLISSGSLFLSQESLPPGASGTNNLNDRFGFSLAAGPGGQLGLGVPFNSLSDGAAHRLTTSGPGDPLDAGATLDPQDVAEACDDDEHHSFFRWGFSMLYGRFGNVPSLVVGAPNSSVELGFGGSGRLAIFTGTSIDCYDQNTPGVLGQAGAGDHFAEVLAKGDFDDNGFDDLVIGVPFEDLETGSDLQEGAVQLIFGSSGGLSIADQQLFDQNDFTGEGAQSGDHFGRALSAGDFDGDGHDDLAIGVPDENVGSAAPDAGTVNVLYGGNQGLSITGNQTFHSNLPAGMPGTPEEDDFLGSSLAAGDFDGNGTDDLAIGMPGEELFAEPGAGAVTVLYGLLDSINAFGTVHFGSAMTVPEDEGNRIVVVHREGGAVLAASVDHDRSSGNATPDVDFVYGGGTESWAAGEIGFELFTVHILEDTLEESDETIRFALSNPSGGLAIGSPSTLTLTIEDDDEGGVVQFQLPGQSFSEGAPHATIAVTRSAGAASGVTVQYTTVNGSAVAGQDYVAQNGTLDFAAGQSIQTIQVALIDDPTDEASETFSLVLSNPGGGATLGGQVSTLVGIVDNDPAGQIFLDGFETGNTNAWSQAVP